MQSRGTHTAISSLSAILVGCMLAACGDGSTSTPPDQLPTGVTCDGDVCRLSGELTQNYTLTKDKLWLLEGGVFVGDDVSRTILTIEPGTTVYGETSSKAFLAIRRGSQIIANGTKSEPIVFTSSKQEGSRARGDWGGLILNGRAPINSCTNPPAGGCVAEGEGGSGKYGGNDPADNSGTLRYVRIEFAGHPVTPENELNGLAFQGVGSGTTIEYIQVHMAADDGVEFFGGTVNFKYILTTGIADDNLDWTDGWRGKGQFFVAQQYEDNGDNGIEADNNGDNNAATPRSLPTLSNITLIGSPGSQKSDVGMLLREGTGAIISNAVVLGWEEACIDIDHDETFNNAYASGALTGELMLANSIVDCATKFIDEPGDAFTIENFYSTLNSGNLAVDPQLMDPFNTATLDLKPAAGSPAASGGQAPADSFFENVSFRGGIDPSNDWIQGWTTTVRN